MRICPRPAPADFSALRAGTLALAALVILGLCGRARGMDESSAAGAVAEPDPVHAMVEYEPAASVARLTEQAGLMLKRKEFALAEQTIARGLQVDATYLPLWLLKAELALGLGNYEEAAQAVDIYRIRHPDDAYANYLAIRNLLIRPAHNQADEAEFRQSITRILDSIPPESLAWILIHLLRDSDFAILLPRLLAGWEKSSAQIYARDWLEAFAMGDFVAARALLRIAESRRSIPDDLRSELAVVLDTAMSTPAALWRADAGSLELGDAGPIITARPGETKFAWFLPSAGWRDVQTSITVTPQAGVVQFIYLRRLSVESFVRIGITDEYLTVQERVPNWGLGTVFEHQLDSAGTTVVTAALRGANLFLGLDGGTVANAHIPLSPAVRLGMIGLAVENQGFDDAAILFTGMELQRIEPEWLVAESPGAVGGELQTNTDITAMLFELADEVDYTPAIFAIANSGVSAYALLPHNRTDIASLRSSVAAMPERLARRAWRGVVFSCGSGIDADALLHNIESAAEMNLEIGLLLQDPSPTLLQQLAQAAVRIDWLLIPRSMDIPDQLREALASPYHHILIEESNNTRRYIPYMD
ncbi:MAG: hypothetical protein LIP23_01970 [Planctomycetes bacterium]|nr:hypothetical protein [Planctomycetota bacterium]